MLMKQIINKASLAIIALAFTSCVKDHLAVDPSLSNNVVEFANTGSIVSSAGAVHPRYQIDLGSLPSGKSSQININLSYSGAETAPQDITVTLVVDSAALAAYNADEGTDYILPPKAVYSLPLTAVIKAGTQKVQLQVAVTNNSSYDFNVNYALPLKIQSVSSGIISGNFGTAIYSFAARNIYYGVYVMTGTMTDQTSSALTGYYPLDMDLITYSGNSIALYDPNVASTYGHPIKSGTSNSYYGTFSPVFIFDANGNITDVTNYYGQEAGANKRSGQLDPTGVNKITFNGDGTVNYFEVSYIMIQNGSPRTYFKEKFTYKSSR
jgi:hypothetical protein